MMSTQIPRAAAWPMWPPRPRRRQVRLIRLDSGVTDRFQTGPPSRHERSRIELQILCQYVGNRRDHRYGCRRTTPRSTGGPLPTQGGATPDPGWRHTRPRVAPPSQIPNRRLTTAIERRSCPGHERAPASRSKPRLDGALARSARRQTVAVQVSSGARGAGSEWACLPWGRTSSTRLRGGPGVEHGGARRTSASKVAPRGATFPRPLNLRGHDDHADPTSGTLSNVAPRRRPAGAPARRRGTSRASS